MLNHNITVVGKSYYPVPKYITNINVYQTEGEPLYWFGLEIPMSEMTGMTLAEKNAYIQAQCEAYYQTDEVQAIVASIEMDMEEPIVIEGGLE